MTRSTLHVAAALTAATAILLTACGGNSAGDSDAIAGTKTTTPTPATPGTSPTDAVKRPDITLPSDVKHIFEGAHTGDPKKDAALSDNAEAVKAVDAAIVAGKPDSPAIGFYYEGDAAAAMSEWVRAFVDHRTTITGTVRYYNRSVTFTDASNATLVYCGDESRAYNKDRATGRVTKTPATRNSYVIYNSLIRKNAQGVWQAFKLVSRRGAAHCQL